MKVGEIRDLAKYSKKKDLIEALVVAYKALPKAKKEIVDETLPAVLKGEAAAPIKARKEKEPEKIDMEALDSEIQEFLSNVEEGYYYAPNRVIPKAQRSKWRFVVRNYIKQLNAVSDELDDYGTATDDLVDLYKMLCRGCEYYEFNTDDTFASIQMPQPEVFRIVLDHLIAYGFDEDNVKEMAELSCLQGVSRDNLISTQMEMFYQALPGKEEQKTAENVLLSLIQETKEKIGPDTLSFFDQDNFDRRQEVECYAQLYLWLALVVGEDIDRGITGYFEMTTEKNKEIALYIAMMDLPDDLKTPENRIRIYDYAVNTLKVKPREALQTLYQDLQKEVNGEETKASSHSKRPTGYLFRLPCGASLRFTDRQLHGRSFQDYLLSFRNIMARLPAFATCFRSPFSSDALYPTTFVNSPSG